MSHVTFHVSRSSSVCVLRRRSRVGRGVCGLSFIGLIEDPMLFQEATPDTVGYLIAGYVVIFGLIGLFLFSLVSRWRNLKKDLSLLDEIENDR